jgi:starch phosphorylase
LDREGLKRELLLSMVRNVGRDPSYCTKQDWFYALAHILRGGLSSDRVRTWRRNFTGRAKWVYYLSMELLPGRMLKVLLAAEGITDICREALRDVGVDLDELWEFEAEPALGNGGLGRLASCLLESMATLNYVGLGYSIRYEFGMFRQKIENGEQVEQAENWLKNPNPWEFARPHATYPVHFKGRARLVNNWRGEILCEWSGTEDVTAVAHDLPVVGVAGETISAVRLWSAKATQDFDLSYFNVGNYIEAVKGKSETETLSRVLYPSDSTSMGRELRLKQEYFLVSASLQDILARHYKTYESFDDLPNVMAIQLNDTHPVLAIPEMMRLLVDIHRIEWERAWDISTRIFSFTNHTLLWEALETWSVELFERLLPRHLQIIYEINHRFLRSVIHRHPGDVDRMRRMSLVDENPPRSVRMAHLAIVGSHKVNGVSRLHTALMGRTLFRDFAALFPDRFINLTNGISPRVWLAEANPGLSGLITSRISDGWLRDLDHLQRLEGFVDDADFRDAFWAMKHANKRRLASLIRQRVGIAVSTESMFDVHIKRIHEYKRQLLNLLYIIQRYNRIRLGDGNELPDRTVIFAGKAAPGYFMAKRIIHLINCVADTVNNDPAVGDRLKIVFVPNYDVQTAEDLIPAGDLSQQISAVGNEASGTGNMKLALNGALTIASHDGANDEIAEAVGEENIFMFGPTYDEQLERRQAGYNPAEIYESNANLRRSLDMVRSGFFCPEKPDAFVPICDSLVRHGDYYMVLADYDAYAQCQERVDAAYRDRDEWLKKAIRNVARMGCFSIDRLVREYADQVWDVKPMSLFDR